MQKDVVIVILLFFFLVQMEPVLDQEDLEVFYIWICVTSVIVNLPSVLTWQALLKLPDCCEYTPHTNQSLP